MCILTVNDGHLPIHIDNSNIPCQILEGPAIPFDQNVTNKESMVKFVECCHCASNQNLTHSGSQMADSRAMLSHPFCKPFILNIVSSGYQNLGTQEKRSENVPLDGIMSLV